MRLSQPFYPLAVSFDTEQLQAEVAALPPQAWVAHPDRIKGNSAVRLISAGGAETDDVYGQMRPTPWLEAMPYFRQVLAGFGVVWSRSRLMRLDPGTGVPEHADINYHWHNRVRLHIPVFTHPKVRFHCDGQSVHMGAGEAWVFDNWRRHHVENAADTARIHLVADTTGTAAFWQFVRAPLPAREHWPAVAFDRAAFARGAEPVLLTETAQRPPVMSAAEVQLLTEDFRAELIAAVDSGADPANARERAARLDQLLENLVFDWRQLCALHGTQGEGRDAFRHLAAAVHEAARPLAQGLIMRMNGASALLVLEKRLLQHLVADT